MSEHFCRYRFLCHHEHYDGTGYPKGLEGEDIPLGARILAVADAYAAMTADRSYRRALERGSGSQFDPRVVGKFLGLLGRQGEGTDTVGQADGEDLPER